MTARAAARLVALAEDDLALRGELAAAGELFTGGYHPRMAALHGGNAAELEAVIAVLGGWPTPAKVGAAAAEAAWLIAQHAIGEPRFQRRCAALVAEAVARGEAPPAHLAFLEDRIAVMEGRPQTYGTQFDWDAEGELSPATVAEPDGVEARRRSVGLGSLAERQAELRARAAAEGDAAPSDWTARQADFLRWAREVGWR